MNHQTRNLTSPNVAASSGGVIQSTTAAAMKERMQGTGSNNSTGNTSHNFSVSNANSDSGVRGGNGFGSGLSNRTANDLAALVTGGLLVKDAKQINSEMDSKNGRDCFSHLSGADQADLVKDLVLHTMQCNTMPVSPKRMSPTRSSLQATLSPSRSRSPPLNLLLGASSMDGKLGVDCLNSAFPLPSSNASVPLSINSDSTAPAGTIEGTDVSSVTARAIGSLLAGSHELGSGPSLSCHPNNPSASPTGNSMASSEDSVDSSNSRSNNARRRRKPERTNKMNAAFPMEEEKSLFPIAKVGDGAALDEMESLRSSHTLRNDITALAIEGINALSHGLSGSQCADSQNLPLATDGNTQREGNGVQQDGSSGHMPHDVYLHTHHAQRKALSEMPQAQQKLLENLIQSNISSNNAGSINSNLQTTTGVATSISSSAAEAGATTISTPSTAILNTVHSKQQANDDCETIDKIAAMVSCADAKFSANKTEPTNANGVAGSDTNCNGPAPFKVNAQEKSPNKAAQKANASDSSYEEVENKLEEMFAGIEELSEKCTEQANRTTDSVSKSHCTGTAKSTEQVSPNDDPQKTEMTDDGVMAQLTKEALVEQSETNRANLSNIPSSGASGKKTLTPAQKRSMGNKSQSGEMVTSTPAVKRKRGPKKKSNAHSRPFMEPEGTPMMGLKALANKKKGKKGKAAAAAGPKGKGTPGRIPKTDDRESSLAAAAAVLPAGGMNSILDTGKYKGPYVQVKTDGSHTVINAPINEEDSDKPQNKTKKFGNSLNSSERSKIRGLHVSTLSTKYDADTTDMSWMCVFCKTGPHKFRLGDLFGPYIISTQSSEFEQSQIDLNFFSVTRTRDSLESQKAKENRAAAERQKEQQQQALVGPKSKKRKNASTANAAGSSAAKTVTPKEELCDEADRSRQQSDVDIFYGMMKAGDHTYEVWTHEDCLVWAPGVHMVGTRVVGLEAAIWNCCRHLCKICNNYGAVLNCLHHGCQAKAHYICAHKQNWRLTDGFQAFCELHTVKEQHDVGSTISCEEDESSAPPAKQPKKMTKCKEGVSLATSAS